MNKNRAIRWLVFAVLMLSLSAASFAGVFVGVSVRVGPPAIPVYAQPICTGPGYLWTPGYWAWDDVDGYYWVPGTWVVGPGGMLWTPGYWGWETGFYRWHTGYWGPHVGFYGGINYGFGYTGAGFWGGEWRGGSFFYNRSVMNVNVVNVRNVYERNVVVNNNRVAFNGGNGGIVARPTPEEERFAHEGHSAPLAAQMQHERAASRNRALFASENHGRPAIAATGRAGQFNGRNVIAARAAGETYRAPAMSPREARAASNENRSENRSETRGTEMRNESRNENRGMARPANRENANRESNAGARNERAQPRQQQQARQEQKQQQREGQQRQRQQAQQQKAERKQTQQAQKQQHEEERRGGGRGPGR